MSNEHNVEPAKWRIDSIMYGDTGVELRKLLDVEPESITEEELDRALAVAPALWVEGWDAAVEHVLDQLHVFAHCPTKDNHYEVVEGELGRPIEEITADDEHLIALVTFLRDISAGVDSAEALRRLPMATIWAYT